MIVALLACLTSLEPVQTGPIRPEPIAFAECAVCGMIVGEQPSPRGQILYRDGTHAHVCSIEELRAVEQDRSARGRPVALFVEDLPQTFDPTALATAPLPWIRVEDAWFVFGVARRGVMGEPVLTYSDRGIAEAAGAPIPWSVLRTTPFHLVPTGANPKPSP